MTDHNDLRILVQGHVPIVDIQTHEELRVLDMLTKIAIETSMPVFKWTVTEGLQRRDIDLGTQTLVTQPVDVLKHIKASNLQAIYILLDFHHYLKDPVNERQIGRASCRERV